MSTLVLGAKIGSGFYGAVYRATWGPRRVAVKKFFVSESESAQEAIQQEIRVLQDLQDRHIIQFYGTEILDDQLVIITELAERGSLKRAIDNNSLSDWPLKTRVAREIACGLAYLHSKRIIHQDLKSDNVLLTMLFEVRLCDFGLSTVKVNSASKSTEVLKGTVRWMAPELFSTRPKYTTKSDVYALGMVMWEIAAECTKPFKLVSSNSMVGVLVERGEREILPKATPDMYREWVERCWEQEPACRPEANEFDVGGNGSEPDLAGDEEEESMLSFSFSGDFEKTDLTSPSHSRTAPTVLSATNLDDSATSNSQKWQQRQQLRLQYQRQPLGLPATIGIAALEEKASAGHIVSQMMLAEIYRKGGEGLEKNTVKARHWFQQAASQGEPRALTGQGMLMLDSNLAKPAYEWFKMAAKRGDAEAQYQLGLLLEQGKSPSRSLFPQSKAAEFYRKAADQGHTEAQTSLGRMYLSGRGVRKSASKGAAWLLKAAEQEDSDRPPHPKQVPHLDDNLDTVLSSDTNLPQAQSLDLAGNHASLQTKQLEDGGGYQHTKSLKNSLMTKLSSGHDSGTMPKLFMEATLLIVRNCTQNIQSRGLTTKHILRDLHPSSDRKVVIRTIDTMLNEGNEQLRLNELDIHLVVHIMKFALQNSEATLVTYADYQTHFVDQDWNFGAFVHKLPNIHRQIFLDLFSLCANVVKLAATNDMPLASAAEAISVWVMGDTRGEFATLDADLRNRMLWSAACEELLRAYLRIDTSHFMARLEDGEF